MYHLVIPGCDADRYAEDCNSTCPLKCKNQTCDVLNGSCIHGCEDPNALTLDCIGISNSSIANDLSFVLKLM